MKKVKVYDLRKEKEIFGYDKKRKQILDANNYVENVFLAIGYASRCWTKDNGKGVFDTQSALRVCNELCAYVRLIGEGKMKIKQSDTK